MCDYRSELRDVVAYMNALDADPTATKLDKLQSEKRWNELQLKILTCESLNKDLKQVSSSVMARSRNVILDRLLTINREIKEAKHEAEIAGNET